MNSTLLELFESQFIPEPNSGCWLWLGSVNRPGGYGMFGQYPRRGAHRASFEFYKHPIPNKAQVLHRCDLPCCVNPDHLFLGSVAENAADKIAKGRDARGERNGQAKITEDDVRAIRSDPRTNVAISKAYGVSETTVSEIKNRVWWKHVA